jgi:hypothetical protein
VAYYRQPLGFTTDANGTGTEQVGPVDQELYFLGYLVLRAAAGQAASYLLQDLQGSPLGGFSGQLAVVGPIYLKPGEYQVIAVSGGPTNAQITGTLVGDTQRDAEALVLRPVPTPAGSTVATLTGPITAQGVTVIDSAGNSAILTRQPGANGDFAIRNIGTGKIILRPNDNAANDFVIDGAAGGAVSIAGGTGGVGGVTALAWPGYKGFANQDASNNGTPSTNWQASTGALNSKFLWRMLPTGSGDGAVTGDRAELTWGGDSTPTWWGDRKVRQRIADNVKFLHVLSDSNVGVEPITRYVLELDGTAHSAGVEQVTFVRNTFIDGAAGDNQIMFDLKGDTGLIGLAQTKIAINSLKIGPAAAGADITLLLDDGANRTAITRQTGANADLIVRNLGTGGIVLRPNDAAGNDLRLDVGGLLKVVAGGSFDTIAAGALSIGPTNANAITIGPAGGAVAVAHPGGLTIGAGKAVDTAVAGALNLGTATANAVTIGGAGFAVGFPGGLTVGAGKAIDTTAAGALNLGTVTANLVSIGSGGIVVALGGLADFKIGGTALGGGAAPTFGTIGGAGPAVAAQNSWLKIRVNGTDSWIPIWR